MQPPLPETLLSSFKRYQNDNILPTGVVHPFENAASESSVLVEDLIKATSSLSTALHAYSSIPWSNPKLVSLLRQNASIAHTLHLSDKSGQQFIAALRERSGVTYGESIPLDPALVPEWCISRLEYWGASVGMETFKDDSREGDVIAIVLGGKVVVVDIDFAFDRENSLKPIIKVLNVKTSYAIASNGSSHNDPRSVSLDTCLAQSIQNFCIEVQRDENVRSPLEAARLGKNVLEQLKYLVVLDTLAQTGGIKWFVDMHELGHVLEEFARSEANSVASSLPVAQAPLDIFLLRSHSLPLPYTISPSISFLTYLSPEAYLSLFREAPSKAVDDHASYLDISLPHLRSNLANGTKGATIATLLIETFPEGHLSQRSMPIPGLTERPTFHLGSNRPTAEHAFPRPADEVSQLHVWMLDFTQGGKYPGIVMSQSRMGEIELIVNPLSGMEGNSHMLSFRTGSWVDLLLNPGTLESSETYTSVYTSPTGLHPPLHLRLTAPEEPGFLLQQVPVQNMREVWGILEVVREQCWLNGVLSGCDWSFDKLESGLGDGVMTTEVKEEELQAILTGTYPTHRIPVNVSLTGSSVDPIFGESDLDPMSMSAPRRPKITMSFPERPPMSGLVEITVAFDESKPRGVAVEVRGAMGADIKLDVLEEISRRGGTLGLCGRVWIK
ncbi:uncharacterized protein LACBIDRAFT_296470 [Laccaria bicolor S238N-H82]|uniref:Predicted protein n=1 Tax=Laccaria bicolor (strain S238N-H82 / ATCC MYA-4686) TaxID=486041 RepID=B0D8W4_LACBS|nr:uncharacterized protein LACBIDRAFT_296470 [Laccaria bicolor S238N-H82]EDR09142.1 predicted protein [Laccaria bicolor S238N-H82]|eukprot:XP_001880455.1 predicted protein [Laccaria bicolor S238N-H82]